MDRRRGVIEQADSPHVDGLRGLSGPSSTREHDARTPCHSIVCDELVPEVTVRHGQLP